MYQICPLLISHCVNSGLPWIQQHFIVGKLAERCSLFKHDLFWSNSLFHRNLTLESFLIDYSRFPEYIWSILVKISLWIKVYLVNSTRVKVDILITRDLTDVDEIGNNLSELKARRWYHDAQINLKKLMLNLYKEWHIFRRNSNIHYMARDFISKAYWWRALLPKSRGTVGIFSITTSSSTWYPYFRLSTFNQDNSSATSFVFPVNIFRSQCGVYNTNLQRHDKIIDVESQFLENNWNWLKLEQQKSFAICLIYPWYRNTSWAFKEFSSNSKRNRAYINTTLDIISQPIDTPYTKNTTKAMYRF